MSYNVHTTTTQSSNLASSLLNTPFVPATEPKASRRQRNRENRFPCTWEGCDRFFQCPHNVKQHIREAHTLEKPYVCDECAAQGAFSAFSRQYGLNRHKRQVHFIGTKPAKAVSSSSASDLQGPAVPQWANPSQFVGNHEFADMGAMLTETNTEMDAVSNGFGMSDLQFQFDAGPPGVDVSNTQNGDGLACGECGYAAAKNEDILMHMHAFHGAPNTRFCTCSICSMMFVPSEEDAISHATMLGNGALNVPSDANFGQEGPDGIMEPAWPAQLDAGYGTGWDTIDPAMLSFTGS